MGRSFEVTMSFNEGEKPFWVQVAIPEWGKVWEKYFKFALFHEAIELTNNYAHAYRKSPDTILEFHQNMITKYDANELQYKMKV